MAKKKTNVASGDDVVAVQVGAVYGRSKKEQEPTAPAAPAEEVKVKNVRSGDAQVGAQADEIRGGLFLGRHR